MRRAVMTRPHPAGLAVSILLLAALLPLRAQACCGYPEPAASATSAAAPAASAVVFCASCSCKRKAGGAGTAKPPPASPVVCGNAVATVNVAGIAGAAAQASAPSKTDDAKGGLGDAIDSLPAGINARAAALLATGFFMLLGMALLSWALMSNRRRGRIMLQMPLTFGGRGYGWEATWPLGMLVCSGVCFALAVLLLLQLLNSSHVKPAAAKPDKTTAPSPAPKTS